jgi:hypothetical protein
LSVYIRGRCKISESNGIRNDLNFIFHYVNYSMS